MPDTRSEARSEARAEARRGVFVACAVTPGDRAARAVGAVMAAGFATVTSAQPWCAVPAAVCAAFLLVGAITGWCPTSLLGARWGGSTRRAGSPNATHGYPDASAALDLSARPSTSPREGSRA